MTRNLRTLLIGMLFAGTACGGDDSGSGIDASKKLVDLDSSDKQALCDYTAEVQMAPRDVTCSASLMIHLKSAAECVAVPDVASTCTATVAQAEACARAVGADPCSFEWPECAPILSCSGM